MNERYSSDGLIHDNERLAELQALPLHQKIGVTIARVTEWYEAFDGNIFVSLSGGKDSTVLWDIVHKLFPDVPAVFSNTGLEYPEISEFAKGICTDVVSPKMAFTEVIKNYGYPIISKEVSEAIYYARRNNCSQTVNVERERERESRTNNLQKALRTLRNKTRHIFLRSKCGERCLWVASGVRTGLRNLSSTKRSGCRWSTLPSKSLITVAM